MRSRLAAPSESVGLADFPDRFFGTDIALRIDGAGAAVADPGLAGRIRGAFGARLVESASPEARSGKPCPWDPPCAFEVLFRKQGRIEAGLDFPAPWVVLVDAAGRDLVVTLRLFGFACDYAPAAAEAFAAAATLRLDLSGKSGLFLPKPQIVGRTVEPSTPPRQIAAADFHTLDFLSPVAMSSHSAIERPGSLISGAAARASGLARWHDCALDFDRQSLKEAVGSLELEWSGVHRQAWLRGSRPQDRNIPMHGYAGRLHIDGPGEALGFVAPLLALGERMFIGADVAFGCGRYRILEE